MCSSYIRAFIPDEEEPWDSQQFEAAPEQELDFTSRSYSATISKPDWCIPYNEAVAQAKAAAKRHADRFPHLTGRIVVRHWYWCHGDEPGSLIDWR